MACQRRAADRRLSSTLSTTATTSPMMVRAASTIMMIRIATGPDPVAEYRLEYTALASMNARKPPVAVQPQPLRLCSRCTVLAS